ncbi:MAG: peptidylprolyl isomerase [Nanoarchaeota archaeon]|nr:peptidylprolyl isomerase [Nanoarchaeota archaeon]
MMKKTLLLLMIVLTGCSMGDIPESAASESFDSAVPLGKASPSVSVESTALFETNQGSFEIELFIDEMPVTTGNFIKLAKDGFYDQTEFHRIIGGFMIQGGDPLSKYESKKDQWGTGGPGYQIKDEFAEGLSNTKGTLAMANSGPNSGGSQFFINLGDNSYLDFDKPPMQSKHPVFGKVVKGMHIVEKIGTVSTNGRDQPLESVVVEKVTIK